jgi:hypothetical protein
MGMLGWFDFSCDDVHLDAVGGGVMYVFVIQ